MFLNAIRKVSFFFFNFPFRLLSAYRNQLTYVDFFYILYILEILLILRFVCARTLQGFLYIRYFLKTEISLLLSFNFGYANPPNWSSTSNLHIMWNWSSKISIFVSVLILEKNVQYFGWACPCCRRFKLFFVHVHPVGAATIEDTLFSLTE